MGRGRPRCIFGEEGPISYFLPAPRDNYEFSVARCGLFPAKWLIFNSGGGQKLVALSHQNVAYFHAQKWRIWLILKIGGLIVKMWLKFVEYGLNLQ